MYELLQGRVLFRGRPGPKDAWTAEEDQLAQMIELFGPIPSSVRKRGKLWSKFFDEDGKCIMYRLSYTASKLTIQAIYCTSSNYTRTHCETLSTLKCFYELCCSTSLVTGESRRSC
jgi:hypothetical protein